MTEMMFDEGQKVVHIRTNNVYYVLLHALDVVTLDGVYVYKSEETGMVWVRRASLMEDGRFMAVD